MECRKITEKLELSYPLMYAMEWDNVGLLVGDEDADIRTVLVALDVTDETVAHAVNGHAELIVTHHPLLFTPLKRVVRQEPKGRCILEMASHGIGCYAMHTNFDVAEMADLNADELQLVNPRILEETYRDETGTREGLGRIGTLENAVPLRVFAETVRDLYRLPSVRVYGNPDREIRTAAILSGSGKSLIEKAVSEGADVFVTGDLDYHTAIDAVARGICLLDAGHYGTEFGFIPYMTGVLKRMFPELTVLSQEFVQPYTVV